MAAKSSGHRWTFPARFRRRGFGWRSQPAAQRVRQAVDEILRVARKDPLLAGEGAVMFLERVSPALEQVDSSSGAIGSAVNRAIEQLVPVIAAAPADRATREAWLERLWAAHEADQIPYIERLGELWGEVCSPPDVASAWADRLLGPGRAALRPNRAPGGFFHGTSAFLSALYSAGRYTELLSLLEQETFWPYKLWAVKALAATGKPDEALRLAESTRDRARSEVNADAVCEEILLGCGRVEEAYARYGLRVNSRDTYVATFRAIAAKYPAKAPRQILADLVAEAPGEEGKWFAAAKDAKLFDEALELATRGGCDPRTLGRAARDFAERQPKFAARVGLLALDGFVHHRDHGLDEVDRDEVWMTLTHTLAAAESCGQAGEVRARVRELAGRGMGPVRTILISGLGPEDGGERREADA